MEGLLKSGSLSILFNLLLEGLARHLLMAPVACQGAEMPRIVSLPLSTWLPSAFSCLPSFMAIFVKNAAQTSESICKSQSVISEFSVTTCRRSTSCIIRADNPCLEIFWKLKKWECCQKNSNASSLQCSDGDEWWVIPRRQSIYQPSAFC